jgi:hypothetical protein
MLRTFGLLAALALSLIGPEANYAAARTSSAAETCCKHCHKGKACGNACIAREATCNQPPGCACDSWFDDEPGF